MTRDISTAGARFIAPTRMADAAGRDESRPYKLPIVALAVLFAGCSSTPQSVPALIPVPCRVALPARPLMPTEGLPPDVSLDDFIAAAAAEIERREGYEIQLRAALAACGDGGASQ